MAPLLKAVFAVIRISIHLWMSLAQIITAAMVTDSAAWEVALQVFSNSLWSRYGCLDELFACLEQLLRDLIRANPPDQARSEVFDFMIYFY